MVHSSFIHVLREVYEEIVAEDFASPDASWKGAGCDTLLAPKRIEHGFSPTWVETPSVRGSLYAMLAKDINFSELLVHPEFMLRMKKIDNKILNGDLLVAFNVTNTFTKAENIIAKMFSVKDPLIMCFESIKIEQNLIIGKVCACFIDIIVRGINCYVLY